MFTIFRTGAKGVGKWFAKMSGKKAGFIGAGAGAGAGLAAGGGAGYVAGVTTSSINKAVILAGAGVALYMILKRK